jgi:molybdate transport system ATP-binding protein
LLQRRFKYLSTGETRKTLLCQALMTQPDLLILDEPFDGLDVASRQQLAGLLERLHLEGLTLVLVLNRFDEIPSFVQFAGVLADCTLSETGEKQALLQQALIAQLAHSEKLAGMSLPEPDAPAARHALDAGAPRIVLRDGVVSYNDRPIIERLSWTVNPGEHWQIVGPNGAGNRPCSVW